MDSLKAKLVHAVTSYDRAQANRAAKNPRASHNVYALAQYLQRVDDILSDVDSGATPSAAIIAGFGPGALRNKCLKAAGASADNTESHGNYRGMPVYKPASQRADDPATD